VASVHHGATTAVGVIVPAKARTVGYGVVSSSSGRWAAVAARTNMIISTMSTMFREDLALPGCERAAGERESASASRQMGAS